MVVYRKRNRCRRVPVDLIFRLQVVFSKVIVDITISCSSFVFSQSRAKVSAGFTNLSGPALPESPPETSPAAKSEDKRMSESQHLIFYTAPCLSSGLSLSLTLVSSRRKVVIGLCATRILLPPQGFRPEGEIPRSHSSNSSVY